jgi:hypothetical protein
MLRAGLTLQRRGAKASAPQEDLSGQDVVSSRVEMIPGRAAYLRRFAGAATGRAPIAF